MYWMFVIGMDLTIEVTNSCINNCIHCSSRAVQDGDFLDMETMEREIRVLNPEKVILSGGEPLLHPEIENIIYMIKAKKINLAINTCGVFMKNHIPKNLALVDELYVSYFKYPNHLITRFDPSNQYDIYTNTTRNITEFYNMVEPSTFIVFARMDFNLKNIWVNTVIIDESQIIDIPMFCYYTRSPVHLIRLLPHGRADKMRVLPLEEQSDIARKIIDQLDPSKLDERIPEFLRQDGYDEIAFPMIKRECKKRLSTIHPKCKISHSLIKGKCRAIEKRTLLHTGKIIGCVAGKEIDERVGIQLVCEKC